MIGPDLRSSAFQVLSALTVPENRSAQGNMTPAADLSRTSGHGPLQPQAFHNQRPQAIAATAIPACSARPQGRAYAAAQTRLWTQARECDLQMRDSSGAALLPTELSQGLGNAHLGKLFPHLAVEVASRGEQFFLGSTDARVHGR